MEDALAFGGACISLLNHADRVKCACLAQLVNAIAPILTETGGPAWRQTIFYPFAHFSNLGRGRVLRTQIDCPTYDANYYDPRGLYEHKYPMPDVPSLKLAAVNGEGSLTLFALNRHLNESMPLTVAANGFAGFEIDQATTMYDGDLQATNTKDAPDRIKPAPLSDVSFDRGQLRATLPPASWTVIRLGAGR
jgi:alpha-N-arabinofuranosidase